MGTFRSRRWVSLALALCAPFVAATHSSVADACGCLAPPLPTPGEVDFAVNQQAEQIIFEVGDGFVDAHVLIRYAGAPESFGWLVPVPNVPTLSLSYAGVFGLIDEQTRPQTRIDVRDACPSDVYRCREHGWPDCGGEGDEEYFSDSPSFAAGGDSSGGSGGSGASAEPGAVMVYAREQIGAYDTVVLGSGNAEAIVMWLNDNDFIVNETMTPYMQPYLDANMLFVAARLVPGAGIDQIRPLRMRYTGTEPSIPLRLTAVAAEPHLTVTAYIYSNTEFQPVDKPVITLDGADAAYDRNGRDNYPMLLNRTIDEAGGEAFVKEYAGPPPVYVDESQGCCDGTVFGAGGASSGGASGESTDGGVDDVPDLCGIANDGQCQCPGVAFDASDCTDSEEISGTIALATELAQKYTYMTRLTTRLSPEEMTFDPVFEPAARNGTGRLLLQGEVVSIDYCVDDVIDQDELATESALADCSTIYCGEGECVAVLGGGTGCACNAGFMARTFSDLDGLTSLTCVPETSPVDLGAGGLDLPDVCAEFAELELGRCRNLGGFPAVKCDSNAAAVINGTNVPPTCAAVIEGSGTAGTFDRTEVFAELEICAPAPPRCSVFGWLERIDGVEIEGVECPSSIPDASWLEIPREPTCDDVGATLGGADATTAEREDQSVLEPVTATVTPRPPVVRTRGCSFEPRSSPSGLDLRFGLIGLATLLTGLRLRRRR